MSKSSVDPLEYKGRHRYKEPKRPKAPKFPKWVDAQDIFLPEYLDDTWNQIKKKRFSQPLLPKKSWDRILDERKHKESGNSSFHYSETCFPMCRYCARL